MEWLVMNPWQLYKPNPLAIVSTKTKTNIFHTRVTLPWLCMYVVPMQSCMQAALAHGAQVVAMTCMETHVGHTDPQHDIPRQALNKLIQEYVSSHSSSGKVRVSEGSAHHRLV